MAKNLVYQLQQSVGVLAILLMDFSCEAVAMIHDGVLVIATIEHHATRKNQEASQQDQENL